MKIKKLFVLILILFCTIFTGCANIEFVRFVDGNHAIQDKFVVELDKDKLNEKGYSMFEVLKDIESDFVNIKNSIEDWKKQFQVNPDLLYVYDMVKDGIIVDVKPARNDSNSIYLSITFSNLSMFGLFYGYSTIENQEYTKAMEDVGPFISKMIEEDYSTEELGLMLYKYSLLKDDGILASLKDFEYDGENYYVNYSEYFEGDFEFSDVEVSEIFVYPDDRIYGNADDGEVISGVSTFKWVLSDKDENFQMEIYKMAPNAVNWYVLAIIISCMVVVVLFIIMFLKSKQNVKGKSENE